MGAYTSFTQFDEVIVKVGLDNSLNKLADSACFLSLFVNQFFNQFFNQCYSNK